MRHLVASFVIVAAMAHAADARCADPPDEAHRLANESFQQGEEAYTRGDFAAAAAAFEAAARFVPHPSALLDAEEAWERVGDPVRAAEDCDQVLAMSGVDARFANEASARLRALESKLAVLDLRGPAGAQARVDGRATIAVPAKQRVRPGHHTVAVVGAGSAEARSVAVDVGAGERASVDLTPLPSAIPSAAPAKHEPPHTASAGSAPVPPAAVVAFAAAGVGAVATGIFGVMTVAAKSDYDQTDKPSRDQLDTFKRDRLVTNVALGATLVALGVGVVLWATTKRPTRRAAVVRY